MSREQKGLTVSMPTAFPALALSLEPSTNLGARDLRKRCPDIRFILQTADGRQDLGAMRTDIEKPRLNLADGSAKEIDAGDTIPVVIDEAAWLAELARVLAPGGTLRMTVPASGPLAWADARNTYRYVVDILGRGNTPNETLPTGWNRHYGAGDVDAMLADAGFRDIRLERVGIGLAEPVQLGGLMLCNFLLGRRDTELRLRPARTRIEEIDARIRVPGIGTRFVITARRAATEPEDPADDDAAANQPAPEIDHE